MGERGPDDRRVDLQQRRRQLDQVLHRQPAMAFVGRLLKGEGNAGAHPLRRLPRHAELHGDGVGGAKPDAANVAGEPIWVLGHDLDGVVPIGLEDADRPRRADAIGMEEDHDVADGLLLRPAGGDFPRAEFADAGDFTQLLRARLDYFERRLAEGRDDPFGELGANAAHHAGAEIFLDSLRRRRRRGLQEIRLELKAVAAVGDPDADRVDVFPGGDRRHVADDGDEVALAARLHLQHGKAVVVVMKRHPLDGADERLSWRRGVERWFQRRTGTGPSHRHFDGSLQNDFRRI